MTNVLHFISIFNLFLGFWFLFALPIGLYVSSALQLSSEIHNVFLLGTFCIYMSLVYPTCRLFLSVDSVFFKRKKLFFLGSLSFVVSACLQTFEMSSLNKQAVNADIAFQEMGKNFQEGKFEDSLKKNFTAKEYGKNAPILKKTSELLDFITQQEKILITALQEAEFETMLAHHNFDRRSIQNSLQKLTLLKQQVDENLRQRLEFFQKYAIEMKAIIIENFPHSNILIRTFTKDRDDDTALVKKIFAAKRAILRKTENILNYLLEIQGSYVYEDGLLTFDYDEDLLAYREHLMDYDELVMDEHNLLKTVDDNNKLSPSLDSPSS